ncbi:MAG: hypothetical protein Q7S83_03025 [bacterium]|nr:hypothetical protein [bacterium]
MNPKKNLAISLRQQNKSYNEISTTLGIAKSTLSEWFKNNRDSERVKRLLSRANSPRVAERIKKFVSTNREKWLKWRQQARFEAESEFRQQASKPLFIAGLMLYWGEGDSKTKNPLRLTNSSADMIALYTKFLHRALKVPKEKIRVGLILYKDISQKQAEKFWSETSGLPRNQFYKTQYIVGRHPTKRLENGICMIIVNSAYLKEKVLKWIDLLAKTI